MTRTEPSGDAAPIFAIGDVHGCAAELQMLLDQLPITPQTTLVFLGDYVDRGPQSREVIDIVLGLYKRCKVVALKGNHEQMFQAYLNDPGSTMAGNFIYNGGSATLASYQSAAGEVVIPQAHRSFLNQLKPFWIHDKWFFVHAGVPDMRHEEFLAIGEDHPDLYWSREKVSGRFNPWPWQLVHGHTPTLEVDVSPEAINLDTGCVYNRQLSAMEFPSMRVYAVSKQGFHHPMYLRDPNSQRVARRYMGQLPISLVDYEVLFDFETLNYNEFGLLIRCSSHPDVVLLKPAELVRGHINLQGQEAFKFEGREVRIEREEQEVRYAVRLTRPFPVNELDPLV